MFISMFSAGRDEHASTCCIQNRHALIYASLRGPLRVNKIRDDLTLGAAGRRTIADGWIMPPSIAMLSRATAIGRQQTSTFPGVRKQKLISLSSSSPLTTTTATATPSRRCAWQPLEPLDHRRRPPGKVQASKSQARKARQHAAAMLFHLDLNRSHWYSHSARDPPPSVSTMAGGGPDAAG